MPALKKRKISHEKLVEKEDVFDSEDASLSQEEEEEVPKDADKDGDAKAPRTFKDLGLIPQLCEACETLGYKAPTAIQAESIPLALQVVQPSNHLSTLN